MEENQVLNTAITDETGKSNTTRFPSPWDAN